MKRIILIGQRILLGAVLLVSAPVIAQDQGKDKAAEAEKAWQEFLKAARPPGGPPAEWKGLHPTPEQIAAYEKNNGLLTAKASALAREFYEKFPDHAKAKEAREKELKLVEVSVRLGNTNMLDRLDALMKSPAVPEDERFRISLMRVQMQAQAQASQGEDVVLYVLETGARQLMKDFPNRIEPYNLLLQVATTALQQGNVNLGRRLAKEVEDSKLPTAAKNIMRSQLKRYDAIGKPFVFIALGLDGKEINLEKMRGKVVLIDFWASWCGPCMSEVPNMKKVYDEYHAQGLEIIGVNLDQELDVLKSTVEKHGMNWLHHFDGANPDGGWAGKYGISAIPAMWLIDKQGLLQDLNAREDLEAKVKKLLAEKAP